MRVKIDVLEEDIIAGKPADTENCAVACALRRMGIQFSDVGSHTVIFDRKPATGCQCELCQAMMPKEPGIQSPLPPGIQCWIQAFDRLASPLLIGTRVYPVSFDLEVPAHCVPPALRQVRALLPERTAVAKYDPPADKTPAEPVPIYHIRRRVGLALTRRKLRPPSLLGPGGKRRRKPQLLLERPRPEVLLFSS